MRKNKIVDSDTLRITISVGLVAAFLAIILNMDKLIPDKSLETLLIVRVIIYIYFGFICLCFLLFLLYRGRSLKYISDETDSKASDLLVCLQFALLWLFKRRVLRRHRNNLGGYFNRMHENSYKFWYDEAIRQSFFLPYMLIFYILLGYAPTVIGSYLSLSKTGINFSPLILIFGVFAGVSLLLNYCRYKITGEQ